MTPCITSCVSATHLRWLPFPCLVSLPIHYIPQLQYFISILANRCMPVIPWPCPSHSNTATIGLTPQWHSPTQHAHFQHSRFSWAAQTLKVDAASPLWNTNNYSPSSRHHIQEHPNLYQYLLWEPQIIQKCFTFLYPVMTLAVSLSGIYESNVVEIVTYKTRVEKCDCYMAENSNFG
jgi:hypothetical protein